MSAALSLETQVQHKTNVDEEALLIAQDRKYGIGHIADPVFFDYSEMDSTMPITLFHGDRR